MTIRRRHLVLLVIAAAATIAVGFAGVRGPGSASRSSDTGDAAARRGALPALARHGVRPVHGAARLRPPPSERVAAWLAEHPPSPELRQALLGVAAAADRAARPLPPPPGDSDDEAAAAERASARAARAADQAELRASLRETLRAMSAAERAALRAANVHLIQLARELATRQNG